MTTHVYFVITKAVLPLDLGGPLQAFLEAKLAGAAIDLHYVSSGETQTLGGGLQLAGLQPLPEWLGEDDIIVIPGSYGSKEHYHDDEGEQISAWLKRVFVKQTILSICSGAFMLAKAGLLAHRQCTTHHELTERLKQHYPECKVLENRIFVEDGQVITSAGISSGIDASLYLIGKRFGEMLAMQVAREMLVYLRRSGHDQQHSIWLSYRNHMHRAVHRAQDFICATLNESMSVEAIAQQVGLSQRQLSRVFKLEIGCGLQEYINRLKIARAKELLTRRTMSIESVATECGFSSSRHFRRIWQQFESGKPSQLTLNP